MKQEIFFQAQKYAVSHLDASVYLTVHDTRIYEEDQPPVHFKLIDGTAQSRLHYVCNQGSRLFEDVEAGERGGQAQIDIQINGSEVTPIEFEARLLSGFLDKNNPLMELAHDRAQATIYIIPYVQDQKQQELQKSNVSIVEHQITHEGPEQPYITLRRDMNFYHCTISVTLTLEPPSMTEIAQNEKQATENQHYDPFEIVVPFCKYEVEKRVYLEGLKQIQTVVDAKYVVMVKIVSIQEDEESTSNGSDPMRRNRGDILHRSTHPSCKIILQTDRAFLDLMSSVEITALQTMNRWKLGFCQQIENAKTTQQLINPISKEVKTRCCQSTTNCIFCVPKMIYTIGGCCQNSKIALLGTVMILIFNQLLVSELFIAILDLDSSWANLVVLLILILSGPGMLEAVATLTGFNRKVWEHQVQQKLKQTNSIASEGELSFKFRTDFFGNFSRAPREEADLFVTKPLLLALHHSLFGFIIFFVNLSISAQDVSYSMIDEQTRRFALTMIVLLLLGVVLVITIRRVAESQCKLQSIYGNPGRRKILKVSRDQSYRSLSRQGSSDSLAQSMRKVKNEPKRLKCEVWSGVILLLASVLVVALGAGFVKLS